MRCLQEVFRSIGKKPPDIHQETQLDASLGLQSLDYAELVAKLEEEFGFDPLASGIPPGLETVGDLAALYGER